MISFLEACSRDVSFFKLDNYSSWLKFFSIKLTKVVVGSGWFLDIKKSTVLIGSQIRQSSSDLESNYGTRNLSNSLVESSY